MLSLKDYLGGIVSSVAEARAAADASSAEIAKAYLSNPVLKNYSVPRMRVGDVNIELPVAFDSYTLGKVIKEPDYKTATQNLFEELCRVFEVKSENLYERYYKETNTLLERISEYLKTLYSHLQDGDSNVDHQIDDTASSIINCYINALSESQYVIKKDATDEARALVKQKLINLFVHISADSIVVRATANELKDTPSSAIFKINLTIREEGYSWVSQTNEKGRIQSSLVPE